MTCDQILPLLGPYVDRELSPTEELAMRHHLEGCPACRAELGSLTALRSTVMAQPRFEMPESLRGRIDKALPTERVPWKLPYWAGSFALGALCATVLWFIVGPRATPRGGVQAEIVASHVRSLMPGHLLDVVTSNRHVVKPWFAGKVGVAPSPWDLSAQGYKILGGRLDYIEGKPTAVLVYGRGQHVINLFVLAKDQASGLKDEDLEGFHLLTWPDSDLQYVAIGDTDLDVLQAFEKAYRSQ